jgi:hypothetical protein
VVTDRPTHPRVSPKAARWFSWILTGVWLVGSALMVEVLHWAWWWWVVWLGVVVAVELVFVRWNQGAWQTGKP